MDTGVFAFRLAARAGIIFANVMKPFKVARKIFNLPAFIRTDLIARQATARTQAIGTP
jgi:hypothetical protein